MDEFNQDNMELTDDLPLLVDQLNNELLRTLDTVAPEKEVLVSVHPKQPWYDQYVKDQHHVVRNRERAWLKYKQPEHWKAYKRECNIYVRLLIFRRKQLYSLKVKECEGDTKKLYKLINNITGSQQENPILERSSDSELTDRFANFFH